MPFQKGRSGNPGGRPKLTDEVKEAIEAVTPEAIETLAAAMRTKKVPWSTRVRVENQYAR